MEPKSRDQERSGHNRASLLRYACLALALGGATWFVAPLLLPTRVPEDFPEPPNVANVNRDLRAMLQGKERAARRRPGSSETVGTLAMAYHANLFVTQAERASVSNADITSPCVPPRRFFRPNRAGNWPSLAMV